MNVIINPGSGPVADATEENAIKNIGHFILDSAIDDISWVRIPDNDYGDGRFAFLLRIASVCHEVQMPGLPLEQVRFMRGTDQNIWNFPRLYVDDSSWIWCIAIDCIFNDEE